MLPKFTVTVKTRAPHNATLTISGDVMFTDIREPAHTVTAALDYFIAAHNIKRDDITSVHAFLVGA